MNKALKVSIFFIIGYFLSQLAIYFLSKDNFFTSPMYILLPIFGFFAFYFLTPVIEKYMQWNFYVVLGIFLIVCLIAQYLILYIYAYQIYVVLNKMAIPKDLGIFKQLLESAFFPFIINSVFGMFASKKKLIWNLFLLRPLVAH